MKICDFNGYEMHVPDSGGKAGKGCNRTSTIQVRRANCIVKQIRFTLDDPLSRMRAVSKAKDYARQMPHSNPQDTLGSPQKRKTASAYPWAKIESPRPKELPEENEEEIILEGKIHRKHPINPHD